MAHFGLKFSFRTCLPARQVHRTLSAAHLRYSVLNSNCIQGRRPGARR